MTTQGQIWRVNILTNSKTGLLMAVSEDLKGLYVHGHTEAEIEERIPVAIKAILEAKGEKVNKIVKVDGDDKPNKPFTEPKRSIAFTLLAA